MTAKDARKCIAMLEKAFEWKVYFWWMRTRGKERCYYSIKRAGVPLFDDSSNITFVKTFEAGGVRADLGDNDNGFPSPAEAAKFLVREANGDSAFDWNTVKWMPDQRPVPEWTVPNFESAAELELKLAMEGVL